MKIVWSDNKAANVRRQNFALLRQKFLNFFHSSFSAAPTTAPSFGVIGAIDGSGLSVQGTIDPTGIGVLATITHSFGVSGTIDASGLSVIGIIDPIGIGVTGLID